MLDRMIESDRVWHCRPVLPTACATAIAGTTTPATMASAYPFANVPSRPSRISGSTTPLRLATWPRTASEALRRYAASDLNAAPAG